MNRIDLRVNFTAVVVPLLLPILVLAAIISMLLHDIQFENIAGWDILLTLFIVSAPVFLILGVLNEITVVLSDKGITKRRLLWNKHIEWAEVTQFNTSTLAGTIWRINFVSQKQEITLNAFLFKSTDEAIKLIKQKLPQKVLG